MKFLAAPVVLVLASAPVAAQTAVGQAFPPAAAGQDADHTSFDDIARRAAEALQSNPSQAAKLYALGVAMQPTWAEGWFYLGASQYELRQYREARQSLTRASSLAKDNSAAWAFLGLTDYELADYSQALTHILQAEALGLPNNPQFISTVRVRAALILMRTADFTGAIEQLRPLAMTDDNSAPVIETFGIASLSRPWQPSDIPAAQRPLVELAGRAMWAFYGQKFDEADSLLKQLEEKYPNEPGVHYLRGISLVDRDMEAARKEFEAEAKISPANALPPLQIAILDLRVGETASALPLAQHAVRLAPDNLLCHLVLGRAWLAQSKTAAAIEEFEKALKLNPAYPHTHFYLAQALRQAGRTVEAEREQAEFMKLKDAGNPTAGAGPPVK